MVEPLTEPQLHGGSAKDAFHVVVLSLPGFGFSGPAIEEARLARAKAFEKDGIAYVMTQSTPPQTLAFGLNDSPVGLLAWIGEKLLAWTDAPLDRALLLTRVTIYWLTNTIGSSMRLYAEGGAVWGRPMPSTIPMAVAVGPQDLVPAIRRYADPLNRILRWTELPRGGHFAASEVPELLVPDVRAFSRGFGNSEGEAPYSPRRRRGPVGSALACSPPLRAHAVHTGARNV